jgi:two-component system chemotaxis sensor kinase CheA
VICCRMSTTSSSIWSGVPDDHRLLNDIFRGFHTIKGGAGFLNAGELVALCHLTENLFDKLRNAEMTLTPALMDTIMAATQSVRNMFGEIAQGGSRAGAAAVMDNLRAALAGRSSRRQIPRAWRQPRSRGETPSAGRSRRWPGLAGPACGGDRSEARFASGRAPQRADAGRCPGE